MTSCDFLPAHHNPETTLLENRTGKMFDAENNRLG